MSTNAQALTCRTIYPSSPDEVIKCQLDKLFEWQCIDLLSRKVKLFWINFGIFLRKPWWRTFPYLKVFHSKLAGSTFPKICRTGAAAVDVHPLSIVDCLVAQTSHSLMPSRDPERWVLLYTSSLRCFFRMKKRCPTLTGKDDCNCIWHAKP